MAVHNLLHCERKSGIAWFHLRIGNLKGGWEVGGRCHLCAGEESVPHLLLICPETQRCKGELLKNKWSHIYEETASGRYLLLKMPLN
jgi:hypothetical protein